MNMPKFLKISLLILVPLMWLILIAQITGTACLSYQGFALDKSDNIYLGKSGNIEVLDNKGKLIKNISPMTSRGYRFTVNENNEIIISTGYYWYRKDLSDNLLDKGEITAHEDDPLAKLKRYEYISADGSQYVMKMYFFRTNVYKITDENRVSVYQMPLFDYFIRLLSFVVYPGFIFSVLFGIREWRKNGNGSRACTEKIHGDDEI